MQRALKTNKDNGTSDEVWRGPVVMFKLAKSSNADASNKNDTTSSIESVMPHDFSSLISKWFEPVPPENEENC